MDFNFQKIRYEDLNARQQESFNFQKASAILADYGFSTIRLTSDWQGADFIAQHKNGTFLKVQLKGRLSFFKKYQNQDLYVCFPNKNSWYLYPHDPLLETIENEMHIKKSKSWQRGPDGGYTYPNLSKRMQQLLQPYIL